MLQGRPITNSSSRQWRNELVVLISTLYVILTISRHRKCNRDRVTERRYKKTEVFSKHSKRMSIITESQLYSLAAMNYFGSCYGRSHLWSEKFLRLSSTITHILGLKPCKTMVIGSSLCAIHLSQLLGGSSQKKSYVIHEISGCDKFFAWLFSSQLFALVESFPNGLQQVSRCMDVRLTKVDLEQPSNARPRMLEVEKVVMRIQALVYLSRKAASEGVISCVYN